MKEFKTGDVVSCGGDKYFVVEVYKDSCKLLKVDNMDLFADEVTTEFSKTITKSKEVLTKLDQHSWN